MWSSTLEKLDPSDIQRLVDDEVEESVTMEYKQQLPGGGDEDRREFLYDVAALANTNGGYLVYDIVDRRNSQKNPTGVAESITGVPTETISADFARLENSIRDNITPRLNGIHPKTVECSSGTVLVVSVPRSWNGPHMVTFKQVNKFYGRNSTGKFLMSVDQIRSAFNERLTLGESIRRWRDRRLKLLLAGSGPVALQSDTTLIIHIIPEAAFSPVSVQSTWTLSEQTRSTMHCPSIQFSGNGRYNGDGFLKIAKDIPSEPATGYCQVFRNGIIEYVTAATTHRLREGTTPSVIGQRLDLELIKAFADSRKTHLELNVTGPIYAGASMFGLKGKSFFISNYSYWGSPTIVDDIFVSPEVMLDEDDVSDAPASMRILADMLWQAAGLESSPFMTGADWTPSMNLR